MLRARASVSGLRTDNRRNGEPGTDASFDNMMMQCGWWHGKMQHASEWQGKQQRITGRHLAQWSRGVTTLHHYERISSRDLGWHRRENGRGREKVKIKLLLWQMSETTNLERLNKLKERKNTMNMNEVENSPLERRNKERCKKSCG